MCKLIEYTVIGITDCRGGAGCCAVAGQEESRVKEILRFLD